MIRIRNSDGFEVQFDESTNRFSAVNGILPRYYSLFEMFISVVDELMLDYYVDVPYSSTGIHSTASEFKLVTKFEDITVTNSYGQTAYVNDLYLIWIFKPSNSIFDLSEIFVWRETYCKVSASINYKHSHASRNQTRLSTYCLGATSELRARLNDAVLSKSVDEQLVTMRIFVSTLVNSLNWESKEGVPYIKMSASAELIGVDDRWVSFKPMLKNCRLVVDYSETIKVVISKDELVKFAEDNGMSQSVVIGESECASFKPFINQANINIIEGLASPFKYDGQILKAKVVDENNFFLNPKMSSDGMNVTNIISKLEYYINAQFQRAKQLLPETGFSCKTPISTPVDYTRLSSRANRVGS